MLHEPDDIQRRVDELRAWMSKGTHPRRIVYLATALWDITSALEDRIKRGREIVDLFPEHRPYLEKLESVYSSADEVLAEFLNSEWGKAEGYAKAIFDAEAIDGDNDDATPGSGP